MTAFKIQKFKEELGCIQEIFLSIYNRFLAAIDHLDYHHSKTFNDTQRKQDIFQYPQTEDIHNDNDTLTSEELELVPDVLEELKWMNPEANHKAKRVKRADLLTWFLGWGVFSNSRNIEKIKKNIFILQQQNKVQSFQIRLLAKYLNLRMTHVNRHKEMLYKLDTQLFLINKTLQEMLVSILYLRYGADLLAS